MCPINLQDQGGPLNNTFIHQSTIAYVSVRVVDVPDLNPEFIGAPYVSSVLEHAPVVSNKQYTILSLLTYVDTLVERDHKGRCLP